MCNWIHVHVVSFSFAFIVLLVLSIQSKKKTCVGLITIKTKLWKYTNTQGWTLLPLNSYKTTELVWVVF